MLSGQLPILFRLYAFILLCHSLASALLYLNYLNFNMQCNLTCFVIVPVCCLQLLCVVILTFFFLLLFSLPSSLSDITTELVYLTPELRQDGCVAHALALRAAWALGNYHRFFLLYKRAPRMAAYLIDKFVERERKLALRAILKTWVQITRPHSTVLDPCAFFNSWSKVDTKSVFSCVLCLSHCLLQVQALCAGGVCTVQSGLPLFRYMFDLPDRAWSYIHSVRS